jgi:N-acetylglucosaminyldiphosphoundecaprenol N-acetyl-beta-D-mannosaminyltransferase
MPVKSVAFFQTRVDNLNKSEIFGTVDRFLREPKWHRIVTVNPEFLLLAEENARFREAVNLADANIADGFGLHLAFWRRGTRLHARFPGADMTRYLFETAERNELSVFCLIHKDGLSDWKLIQKSLQYHYPALDCDGHDASRDEWESIGEEVLRRMRPSHIVLCNFGAPNQELFLAEFGKNAGNARLGMGVGGSFDFLTGKMKRAPKFLRAIGLEWLWRFWQQPWRWRRISRAVAVFPWKVLLAKK